MPSSQTEEIKSRVDVAELVGSYVRLTKAGANFKALCPFHNEKTPSFNVSPARQIWHCFGCGKGGDIFQFVMDIEGVEFPEALKSLADRAGVELKYEDTAARSERNRQLAIIEEAAKFFEENLERTASSEFSLTLPSAANAASGARPRLENSSEAVRSSYAYLRSRGLTNETIKKFRLGYAPSEWRALSDHLAKKGFIRAEILKSGLITSSQNSFYDRFRGRIMFPIFDYSGRAIAFGGRIYPENDKDAKYINSPETALYQKSKTLYGLNFAKTEILRAGECVLVEGYMDAIMSWQAGVKNVVAVSGTALTEDQLKILRRLCDKLVVAFDMDSAGEGAAKRGIDMALSQNFDVRVIKLPDGLKDPADAVLKNPTFWQDVVKNARHVVQFYIDYVLGKFSASSPEAKKSFEKNVLPYVAMLSSDLEKAHWVSEIGAVLNMNEEIIWGALSKLKSKEALGEQQKKDSLGEVAGKRARKELLEERILGILGKYPALVSKLDPVFSGILSLENRTAVFAELFLNDLAEAEGELAACQKELKKENLKTRMSLLATEIGSAEKNNDAKLHGLLMEFKKTGQELSNA